MRETDGGQRDGTAAVAQGPLRKRGQRRPFAADASPSTTEIPCGGCRSSARPKVSGRRAAHRRRAGRHPHRPARGGDARRAHTHRQRPRVAPAGAAPPPPPSHRDPVASNRARGKTLVGGRVREVPFRPEYVPRATRRGGRRNGGGAGAPSGGNCCIRRGRLVLLAPAAPCAPTGRTDVSSAERPHGGHCFGTLATGARPSSCEPGCVAEAAPPQHTSPSTLVLFFFFSFSLLPTPFPCKLDGGAAASAPLTPPPCSGKGSFTKRKAGDTEAGGGPAVVLPLAPPPLPLSPLSSPSSPRGRAGWGAHACAAPRPRA